MSISSKRTRSTILVAACAFGLVVSPLALVAPAEASTDGTRVVISEVYGGGGNAGAPYNTDFIELYNPTNSAINLSGKSVQYRSSSSAANPSGVIALSDTIPANGHYLVGGSSGSNGAPIPSPNASGNVNLSGTAGTVFLADQSTALTAPPTGSVTNNPAIIDLVGYGTSNTFETKASPAPSNTLSAARSAAGADADDNSLDLTTGAPTPEAAADEPPPAPVAKTIQEIQGPGDVSPFADQPVTTRGVVTAAYPTGGFSGFYIQAEGSGGAIDPASHDASDAVFVYSPDEVGEVKVGDHVSVAGTVKEFFGLTEINSSPDGVGIVLDPAVAVKPSVVAFPDNSADRESLEGMLIAPQGSYTVADNYGLNQYAEIGLATGTTPLRQPTDAARPLGAEYDAVLAENAARRVALDDGSSTNYLTTGKNTALPYLTEARPIRVGGAATFTDAVVLDYRNNAWKFQPTEQLTAEGVAPATFENTRTAQPQDVGGDLKIASFNVLNYFPTTGANYVASGNTCSFYNDRVGNHITVNTCSGQGPRGAADDASLKRQQDKIVAAISALGADIVSLEEVENSAKYGPDRDAGVSALVDALNASAGSDVWEFAPSPASRPSVESEDVIRSAFIYKTAAVQTVGESQILDDPAFVNARDPLAQGFRPVGGEPATDTFAAIVNHFKSKGSGSGVDADKGDGQGASNASRVNQAKALVTFAEKVKTDLGTDKVFLTGDFNSYTQEDPMHVLYDAGYIDLGEEFDAAKHTYLFAGVVGSLDHMLANAAALETVEDADTWNINSVEPVALEYSRYNYNATDYYEADPYRASDHDPLVVGLGFAPQPATPAAINLLGINDFHGRIDANTTKFATTIEQLRATEGEANTLLLSGGDNVGASLFASSSANDDPTIDVLNVLGLKSAVGNHEFDKGFSDLTGHLADRADWSYFGANVYDKGTTNPALLEYDTFDVGGLTVGVIGAVTKETPSLVTPSGIADLEFGDPVEAVNRVAAQLSDGEAANGEADVLVAEYHEGASQGSPSTIEQEVAKGGAFADIVNKTDASVDAIFTAHTHKKYAWDGAIPGKPGQTRPILQTGSYGEAIGQVKLSVEPVTHEVITYSVANIARVAAEDTTLPRVAEVKQIVTDALAAADEKGKVPVGEVSTDITTAYAGGSNVGGKYVGGTRDDRASESTLGNLVADSLVSSLSSQARGGADIGVVNPGGLRSELFYAGDSSSDTNKDGVVTYAEANSVLPFANNLSTLTLTGAQFKQVLEQQWQTNADGTVPSRPFLHLGLSKNVSTTLDPTKPAGERVTSVRVNGQPLDPVKEYRIGTFNFLATGGDNFRAFTAGTDVRDSGLIDRDAWIDYLGAHKPVSPSFGRRQVYGGGIPSQVADSQHVTFTLDKVDLSSMGGPKNTEVTAKLKPESGPSTDLGTFAVDAEGGVDIAFDSPAHITPGSVVELLASPSNTTVTIPAISRASTLTAEVRPDRVVVNETEAVIVASVTPDTPGSPTDGVVTVLKGGREIGRADVTDDKAEVRLDNFETIGRKHLTVEYSGNDEVKASGTTVDVKVVKASSTMRLKVMQDRIRVKRTEPKLMISVASASQPCRGYVAVRTGGRLVALVRLKSGEAVATLPAFKSRGTKTITAKYLGSDNVNSTTTRIIVEVVK